MMIRAVYAGTSAARCVTGGARRFGGPSGMPVSHPTILQHLDQAYRLHTLFPAPQYILGCPIALRFGQMKRPNAAVAAYRANEHTRSNIRVSIKLLLHCHRCCINLISRRRYIEVCLRFDRFFRCNANMHRTLHQRTGVRFTCHPRYQQKCVLRE